MRPERELADKFRLFKELGFDYVQFHDDDAVPDDASPQERERRASEVRRML
ncbi:MAG: xylose isomerase, partial [Chloroflexota bacterium]